MLADHGGDQVEKFPATQGIVDDMRVVRGPQRRRGPAQVLRHLVRLEHRPVAHVARDRRLRVADDRRATHGTPGEWRAAGGGGARWSRAPIAPTSSACSGPSTGKSLGAGARAGASPPMPPPATTIGFALRAALRGLLQTQTCST